MPKNTMAWSYRKNARHRSPKKNVRKAVCNKTKRKTKNEMAGWRVHGPEEDGFKWMERQSKELRGLEAYCKGGQGPPRAVAPPKKKKWSPRRESPGLAGLQGQSGRFGEEVNQLPPPAIATRFLERPTHIQIIIYRVFQDE